MIELCSSMECTGCGACYNICPHHSITMTESYEGFLYPHIDSDLCVECGLCQRVCPIISPPGKPKGNPEVYAAWNKDDGIRTTSSSGGMFYTLASEVISKGGVVFGVVLDGDGNVFHTKAENLQDLRFMQGSKYVQSDTKLVYREAVKYLKEGKPVMFTGTPCQVAAMKAFTLNKDYENLLLVDIVCHGVPSNKLFKDYLDKLEDKTGKIEKSSFSFRKLDAWDVVPSVELAGSCRKILPPELNVYMRHFLASYTFRESCYACKFAITPRISDITIADFWGIGKDSPFSEDTSKGCSLVLVNTEKGQRYFDDIKPGLFCEKRTLSEALHVNHQLYRPSVRPKQRNQSYRYFFTHDIQSIYTKYYNNLYLRTRRIAGKVLRKIRLIR